MGGVKTFGALSRSHSKIKVCRKERERERGDEGGVDKSILNSPLKTELPFRPLFGEGGWGGKGSGGGRQKFPFFSFSSFFLLFFWQTVKCGSLGLVGGGRGRRRAISLPPLPEFILLLLPPNGIEITRTFFYPAYFPRKKKKFALIFLDVNLRFFS